MNELQVFENPAFGQVRTVTKDGEPWFVAADVCRALEVGRTWNALQRLDSDEKDAISISTPGGQQEMSIINEPGLYTLVLGSRKPEAKAFKRWVTHDVLPALRKHGMYVQEELMRSKEELEKAIARYVEDNSKLREKNSKLSAENAYLEKRNDELFGGYHNACREAARNERILNRYREQEDADGLCDLRTTAGNLCMMEHEFINLCLQRRLL